MQSWTQQRRCVLCQFRALYNHYTPLSQARRCLATESRSRPPKRREDQIMRMIERGQHDPRALRKAVIPLSSGKRDVDEDERTHKETSRRNEIARALRHVKNQLRFTKMSRSSDTSQMEGLDPDGDLWPNFAASIERSLESKFSTSRQSGLVGRLLALHGEDSYRAAVEREIRFAFMDFVLDRDSTITLDKQSADLSHPTEWYPKARMMQRVIHLHVGPTNSGKTYTALKRLEQAKSGFYAGPLRLLAHEVFSRFNNRGVKCDLITGDDVRLDEVGETQLYASTVEMVDSNRESEVGVIDEIQMIGDSDRGWAWTRALLSAQVRELHLCGETRVVPLIREIVASMGDTLHIHQYERLNPLKVMSRSLKGNLQNLRKGDCVVSFSIMNIHALKRQIEVDTGKRCAIIYGSLPPETRAQQAALFNDPDNDYDFLAASDAIGMGLNLNIKRIVFETTNKWNGTFREQLSIPQIKQIAGRAGRFRTARDDQKKDSDTSSQPSTPAVVAEAGATKPKNIGLVTCIDERDLPVLQNALSADGAPLKAAGVLPPGEFYEALANKLPQDVPFEYILRRMNESVNTNDRFKLCNVRDNIDAARAIEGVKDLSVADRLTICAAPASFRTNTMYSSMKVVLVALAEAIAGDDPVTVADVPAIPLEVLDEPVTADRRYLASLEMLHKSLILFLWLSYRFSRQLQDQDMGFRAKELCEEKINTTLLKVSANPKLAQKLVEVRKSSELLREQAKLKGGYATDMPLIMNPDQTVEEIDSARALEDGDRVRDGLDEKVEVQGELDLGEDEELKVELQKALSDPAQDNHGNGQKDREEPQRTVSTG